MDKKNTKNRDAGKWFPILLLVIMMGAAAAAGVHVAGDTARRRNHQQEIPTSGQDGTENNDQPETDGDGNQGSNGTDGAVSEAGQGVSGVLRRVDSDAGTITVYQTGRKEEVELSYNGATEVLTKYGNVITMRQLKPGLLIRTECKEGTSLLSRVQEDADSWVYKGVGNLTISRTDLTMTIGERKYQYDRDLTVADRGELVTLDDLSEKDLLTVRGVESRIYSIEVAKGHGTLNFINYDAFLGGSIEVGYEVFDQIKEGMEYVLREGSYKLVMRRSDLAVNKYVTIRRGEDLLIDLNEYRNEVGRTGLVSFELNPEDAELYLDNELTDGTLPVELGYGEYILEVRCEGYEPLTRLLSVSMPTMSIRIDLADSLADTSDGALSDLEEPDGWEDDDLENSDEEDWWEDDIIEIDDPEYPEDNLGDGDTGSGSGSGSGNNSSGNNGSGSSSDHQVMTGKYIMIRKPEGASVYFDGQYVGIVPVQIEKITGEHQVKFVKDGYISKTYTVDVEKDNENPVFSFPELTKE